MNAPQMSAANGPQINEIDFTACMRQMYEKGFKEAQEQLKKIQLSDSASRKYIEDISKIGNMAMQIVKRFFNWFMRLVRKVAHALGFGTYLPENPTKEQFKGEDDLKATLTPLKWSERTEGPKPKHSEGDVTDVTPKHVQLLDGPLPTGDESQRMIAAKGLIAGEAQKFVDHLNESDSLVVLDEVHGQGYFDFSKASVELEELNGFWNHYLAMADKIEADLNQTLSVHAQTLNTDVDTIKEMLMNKGSGAASLLAGDVAKEFVEKNQVVAQLRTAAKLVQNMATSLVEAMEASRDGEVSAETEATADRIRRKYANLFANVASGENISSNPLDSSSSRGDIIAQSTTLQTDYLTLAAQADALEDMNEKPVSEEVAKRAESSLILRGDSFHFRGAELFRLPAANLERMNQALGVANDGHVEGNVVDDKDVVNERERAVQANSLRMAG